MTVKINVCDIKVYFDKNKQMTTNTIVFNIINDKY